MLWGAASNPMEIFSKGVIYWCPKDVPRKGKFWEKMKVKYFQKIYQRAFISLLKRALGM